MSETQGISDLSFNGLLKAKADGDKSHEFNIGVFKGTPSMAIFKEGERQPVWKVNLPNDYPTTAKNLLNLMKDATNGFSITTAINERWDAEARKMISESSITYGIDDKGLCYIGITTNNFTKKFILRMSSRFDLNNTPFSKHDQAIMAFEHFVYVVSEQVPTAVALSSFKRTPPQGGWNNNNNRGGGGGYANNNRGGGNVRESEGF